MAEYSSSLFTLAYLLIEIYHNLYVFYFFAKLLLQFLRLFGEIFNKKKNDTNNNKFLKSPLDIDSNEAKYPQN